METGLSHLQEVVLGLVVVDKNANQLYLIHFLPKTSCRILIASNLSQYFKSCDNIFSPFGGYFLSL